MMAARAFPRSLDELSRIVRETASGAQSVAMQAGHFLLYYDVVEDRIVPCISDELESPRHLLIRKEAGNFPLLSWRFGLEVLEQLPAVDRSVMIVVNDWQYLPKGVDRRRFYSAFPRLPKSFKTAFDPFEKSVRLLTPPDAAGTKPFFGEMNLRNQYRKVVERLIRAGTLPAGAVVENENGMVVCNLPDSVGRSQEVYCSNKTGDCAAEIAQMLAIAKAETNCECFINLYPVVCRDFVERGTELGETLLGNRVPTVINVGLQTGGVSSLDDMVSGSEVSVHRFHDRGGDALRIGRG